MFRTSFNPFHIFKSNSDVDDANTAMSEVQLRNIKGCLT